MCQEINLKCRALVWSLGPPLLKPFSVIWRAMVGRCYGLMQTVVIVVCVCGVLDSLLLAQTSGRPDGVRPKVLAPEKADLAPAPAQVDVKPVAHDEEIRTRLQSVLDSTGWFTDPQVRVEEGVVFLNGRTETDELKKWAGDLARNTQDVVAVANRMEVPEPSVWDFGPAWSGLLVLWRDFIRSLPFFAVRAAHPGTFDSGQLGGNARGGGIPSPEGSSEPPAKCDRAECWRTRLPHWDLYRSESFRPDPTGVDSGRRHGADRSGCRHRLPGHHREFSGQHLPQHAAALRDWRPSRGCQRDGVCAAVKRPHYNFDDPRRQPRTNPQEGVC